MSNAPSQDTGHQNKAKLPSTMLWENLYLLFSGTLGKKNTPSITLPKQKEEKLVMSTSPNASFHWSQHYSSAPTLMCRDQSLRETVLTFFLGYYTSHEGLQGERSSVQ